MLKYVLGIILLLVIVLVVYLKSQGAFEKIEFEEKEQAELILIGEKHVGDYAMTGEVQDRLYEELKEKGIETYKGFGIYYDNPREVTKENLRSFVGSILEEKDYDKLEILNVEYDVRILNKQKVVYTSMPYKSKMSIMFGVFKVYPKASIYLTEKAYKQNANLEIYDIPNKKIHYIFPTDSAPDFE